MFGDRGTWHVAQTSIRLVVRGRLVFDRLPLVVDWYGHAIRKGYKKLYWHDSPPHPDNPLLQITHPHHKHVPPDMKRHRIPDPGVAARPHTTAHEHHPPNPAVIGLPDRPEQGQCGCCD
jgi:hypothetical protein